MRLNIAANNFDLLRLCAALQVAILHVARELSPQYGSAPWVGVLEVFSGVPIFFFISGFLISRSYERSKSLTDYALNRTLRIFPALHVCVLLNIIAIALTGYFTAAGAGFLDVAALYAAKTTLFQFYNPGFMRSFGDGVVNGSLWTICVELQFYILTPIIYRLLLSENRTRSNCVLLALVALSLLCNRLLYGLQAVHAASIGWKLVRVSFLPWIYMFLTGVLAQRNFDIISRFLSARALWVSLPLYVGYALALEAMGFRMDNSFSPLLFFPLATLVCAAAYYPSGTVQTLLRGNDVSYGIYIYHVPVMNMFLFYGYGGSMVFTLAVVTLTLVFAIGSWVVVERPCLQRKRRPSHPIVAPQAPILERQLK